MAGRENSIAVLAIQRSSTYWNRFEPEVHNEIIGVALIETEANPEQAEI